MRGKNVGPRRLRWCRVSATELGVGRVHSEGGGRVIYWTCSSGGSLFCFYILAFWVEMEM